MLSLLLAVIGFPTLRQHPSVFCQRRSQRLLGAYEELNIYYHGDMCDVTAYLLILPYKPS